MRIFKVFFSLVFLSFVFVQCTGVDRDTSVDEPRFLKSNVMVLAVKVDGKVNTSTWRVNPKLNLDVYTSHELGKRITFCSDIDSISCILTKDIEFNFRVLVGKDSACTQIKFKPLHIDILKGASKYDYTQKRDIPKFVYQDSSNINLALLKRSFNLDSVAGSGNQISKFINIMHWLHNLIPHDGMHGNPDKRNALDMISICKRDARGLNCRGLATALNECYLSMGFKSRFVTCMPKDSVFNDCHVINMVFSDDLNKWVWMDPTQDAYVMNEDGVLLGIGEVRERLITGEPLILNPNANWNNRHSAVKEEYLYSYMAKNLYRIECSLSSEYDYETHGKGKLIQSVELLPLDAFKQSPDIYSFLSNSGITYTTYKTNNPDVFWHKPM